MTGELRNLDREGSFNLKEPLSVAVEGVEAVRTASGER